ncbi:dihydropteroate synthase [Pedobacter cryophilus]|uniref:dihydropteroate synthase n=1 Tax=Pedobacter cryophilus TaxID=2571271 RepID=A0A4U1BVR3_9SPHI|nr:dihydropteroate synthase [Pedobacter cryophilus]TKB96297.1 dihydropteroate synthase [Pedobacter cryophilus]
MTAKDTFFQVKKTLNVGGKIIDLTQPKVMGILNITPDSFFSGSRLQSEKEILLQAEKMLIESADFLDLGAYSSRVGATDISPEEEEKRLIPAIKIIVKNFPEALLSVDTFRATIAEKAIENGAHIINDISGGNLDEHMFKTVGKLKVPYVLMHMKGNPQTMKDLNHYENMMQEISFYFSEKIAQLKEAGVKDIILDPGFGFAKNVEQNFKLLQHLEDFRILGYPVLAGLSRKSMIWRSLNISPQQALNGTSVLNTIALQHGASILRVHDVKEAMECIKLTTLLNSNAV